MQSALTADRDVIQSVAISLLLLLLVGLLHRHVHSSPYTPPPPYLRLRRFAHLLPPYLLCTPSRTFRRTDDIRTPSLESEPSNFTLNMGSTADESLRRADGRDDESLVPSPRAEPSESQSTKGGSVGAAIVMPRVSHTYLP